VFPTDTVYGIGTRPDDPAATGLLFEAKRRSRTLELPVLGSTTAAIRRLVVFEDAAERLASAFWPGPLTLVLARSVQSAGWDLGGDGGSIGVRVPSHPLALALLASTGPLAVTSANLSGEPPAETCEDVERAFGDLVAVYLCEETPLTGEPSTVVDLVHGSPRLLRTGLIGREALVGCMPGLGALLDSPPSPAE
jgi:tRNA threonylcarbamoyl adenosine modification protein (Sua5/YciO/YrdC/YwlC family)